MRELLREPLLESDPDIENVDLQTLVGIAAAVERASAQRYAMLEAHMRRRGDAATAAAFRAMCEEERAHMVAVEHWAEGLGEQTPDHDGFDWLLPRELASTWDEVSGSATLTPYRAYAIAAVNEQRAFALYSYLSAHAQDAQIAAQAERLALEELRHASLMRRWRRKAWHRERRATDNALPPIPDVQTLREVIAAGEAHIAQRHRDIADELRLLGDAQGARLLAGLSGQALPAGAPPDDPDTAASPGGEPIVLLVAAQEPLEALSERLEAVLRTAEGEMFDTAQAALDGVVKRMAAIGLEIERRMQAG